MSKELIRKQMNERLVQILEVIFDKSVTVNSTGAMIEVKRINKNQLDDFMNVIPTFCKDYNLESSIQGLCIKVTFKTL
jgi:hypothetical protein